MVLLAAPRTRTEPQIALGVITRLPTLLRQARGTKTLTAQAKDLGVSAATLKSLDAGSTPSYATLLLCLRYLSR